MKERLKDKRMWILGIGVIVLIFLVVWRMNVSGVKNKDGKVIVTKGDYFVTGCKDGLSMFEAADGGSEVLKTLKNGDKVELIDTLKGNYWHVLYKEKKLIGYVEQGYLVDDPEIVAEPSKAYVNAEKGEKVSVISNVDIDTSSIGKVMRGEEVKVLSKQKGDYVKVYSESHNVFGFIESARLSGGPVIDAQEFHTRDNGRLIGPGDAPEKGYERYFVDLEVAGYLGLLGKKSEDVKNEIAQLNDQEEVYVLDDEDSYWYVYCPKRGMYGYVKGERLGR